MLNILTNSILKRMLTYYRSDSSFTLESSPATVSGSKLYMHTGFELGIQ